MVNKILQMGIVAIGLIAAAPIVGADTYMLVQGVTGDAATDTTHRNWIRVNSINWGVATPVASGSTGGTTVGRAVSDKIKLTIPTGTWSRDLLNNMMRGLPFAQVIIDHVNPDGRTAYRITIGNLMLSHYGNATTAKAAPTEEIEALMGSYRAEFYTVLPDGRVTTAAGGWNFATNTPIP